MSAVELIDGVSREQAGRQAREAEEVDLHAGARKRSRVAEEHARINAVAAGLSATDTAWRSDC
jgi:hypothetical protein